MQDAPTQESAQESAQEITDRLTDEERIIILLNENPRMTRNEISQRLGISSDAVRRLDKLKKAKKVEHQGSTKAGKWVILNREE